jgi:hypothetical protein
MVPSKRKRKKRAKRFPVEKTSFLQKTGKLLEHRVSQIFRELGFETKINSSQENGVDVKVYYRGRLVLVIEILNWSIGSKLSTKRINCIIKNLTQYDCPKVLIYTVLQNKEALETISRSGIHHIEIGYQILPKYFYKFFLKKNQIEKRKIDSRITKEDIKLKIKEYLRFLRRTLNFPDF